MSSELTIKIEGMSCSGCANTVQEVLLSLPEIDKAAVNHENDEANVQLVNVDNIKDLKDKIKAKIEEEGYKVTNFS